MIPLHLFFSLLTLAFPRDKSLRTSALIPQFDPCQSILKMVSSPFVLLVVTHCITKTTIDEDGNYITNRTVKYLLSILTHKPIVSFDWIIAIDNVVNSFISKDQQELHSEIVTTCVSVKQFPSWRPYAVNSDFQMSHCTKGGPIRSYLSNKV